MSVTTWRYHLPNGKALEGWAIAFLDSIGCFSVLSDYGNYGYRWPQQGWGLGDFREFFVGCDDDYIRRKIAPEKIYDGENTVRSIRRAILEARRCGAWSKDRARIEWDLVDHWSDLEENEVGFHDWYQRTNIDDAYEFACYGPHPQAIAFMERVMPRLRAAIREDLGRAALQSADKKEDSK